MKKVYKLGLVITECDVDENGNTKEIGQVEWSLVDNFDTLEEAQHQLGSMDNNYWQSK